MRNHRFFYLFVLLMISVGLARGSQSIHAQETGTNGLSKQGPWLIFETFDNNSGNDQSSYAEYQTTLWATDTTGAAPIKLIDNQLVRYLVPAPNGHEIFYITASYDSDTHFGLFNPVLHMITLPDGKDREITKLSSPKSDPIPTPDPDTGVTRPDRNSALEAIFDFTNLVWSPDGKWLAFIGAQDGSSSDLYVYSDATGKVTRLTDGPTQVYKLNWSPDSKYIVHVGVDGFGTGAGRNLDKVWAAAVDGSAVLYLYAPSGDYAGDEDFFGWVDKSTFLSSTWYATCGLRKLRTVNLLTRAEKIVYEGGIGNAATGGGTILFVAGDCSIGTTPDPNVLPDGLYLLTLSTGAVQQIVKEPITDFSWQADQNVYYLDSNRQLTPDGIMSTRPESTVMWDRVNTPVSVSRDGKWSAWIDEDKNLFVSAGKDTHRIKISTSNVSSAFWLP